MTSRPRLLVVDDEENIRSALTRWFGAKGFDVDTAEDGHIAVDKCRSSRYDAVTMDLEMPRMNGNQAATIIREMYPDLPIIILTGYFDQFQPPLPKNVAKILVKPLSLLVLEREVRKAIGLEPSG